MKFAVGLPLALVPVLAAQTKPVIDNEHVRVLLVTDQPHHKTPLHEHTMNRVMVYLDAGKATFTDEHGRAQDVAFRAGEVKWSPAGGKHISENTGSGPYRVVEVELKNRGSSATTSALDPVKLVPQSYHVLLENPQVRLLRVRFAPKQKVPLHEHTYNRVIVYLTSQRTRVTEEGGRPVESDSKAGDIRFGGPGRHSEENLGDKPLEVVVVELK